MERSRVVFVDDAFVCAEYVFEVQCSSEDIIHLQEGIRRNLPGTVRNMSMCQDFLRMDSYVVSIEAVEGQPIMGVGGAGDSVSVSEDIPPYVIERFRQMEQEMFLRPSDIFGSTCSRANNRAERLLKSHLNPMQLHDYGVRRCFATFGSESQAPYTICYERNFNVASCAGPLCAIASDVPICDQMLAQKLLIETDEPRFLEIANHRSGGHATVEMMRPGYLEEQQTARVREYVRIRDNERRFQSARISHAERLVASVRADMMARQLRNRSLVGFLFVTVVWWVICVTFA